MSGKGVNVQSRAVAATAGTIPLRDAAGRTKMAAPGASDDVAIRDTVDTHAALTTAHSSTSAATASRIMERDVAGRAKVANPAADDDVATLSTAKTTAPPIVYGAWGDTARATGTVKVPPSGVAGGPSFAAGAEQTPVRAGRVKNLRVRLNTVLAAGKTVDVEILKNDAAFATPIRVAFTDADAAGTVKVDADSGTVAANDLLSIAIIVTGDANVQVSWSFEIDEA